MKSITSNWFECVVSFDKTQENGTVKKVTETYTVDALTFTEAESTITSQMQPYISGEFQIKNINPAQYREIFFSERNEDDRWFKVKIAIITFDEKTMKEVENKYTYLVQAHTSELASAYVNQIMGKTMQDYRIISNVETKIMEVFKH